MNKKLAFGILSILIVAALAWTLRMRAANMLPIDFDEDDYMRAGQEYANLIRTSDWSGFLETNYRPEHPPLAKIAYGILFSFYPEAPLVPDISITDAPASSLPDDLLQAGRTQSAVFGTLTTILLAVVNPLGGLLLAVHTFTIKYTSQVMLDALSAFLSLSAILAYVQFRKKNQNGWFIASAVLLGLAADSKYLHGTVGLAIVADWLVVNKESISFKRLKTFLPIIGWGVLSLLVFFAFNPYLWADPIGRLQESFNNITLPLALPSIAVAGLIAFLMAYSEFTLGWLFVEKADNVTLAMSIYAIVQSQFLGGAQPWSTLGSLTIIMSIPVVVIFLIFQRTLLERMMFGSAE